MEGAVDAHHDVIFIRFPEIARAAEPFRTRSRIFEVRGENGNYR